ncbi:MAG: iron uptake porin [Cyanothece sp. SIO1E1]|nr:iron uptake porin [Cyanothece sp. SIO1E1]
MSGFLWKSLLAYPAVLGAALTVSTAAIAAEETSEVQTAVSANAETVVADATLPATGSATPETDSLSHQLYRYSKELRPTTRQSQVTSVSQLSDVQPTDWAFQALQSLVERYGCIAGFPDGTYRGNRATTRYEFAAGLNACLDRVLEIVGSIDESDLEAIKRLQEEFAAELATLRGRVDSLEARTAELEANQFSTTTKLKGEVIFFVSAALTEDDAFDDQAIFSDRARLNFDTSFTGKDRLRTRIEAENTPSFAIDELGFQFGGDNGNDFELDDLIYQTPLLDKKVLLVVGLNGLDNDNDFSDTISPLDSSGSGGISEFNDPQQYEQAVPGSGAGLGASVKLLGDGGFLFEERDFGLSVDFGYVADSPGVADPFEGEGLFNGSYAASGQLTFTSNFIDVGLLYINSFATDLSEFDNGDVFDFGIFSTDPAIANTFGGQVNIKLTDRIEIGGGIGFSQVLGISDAPDFEIWSYQATVAIRDVLGEGNLLGILAGVPPYTRDLVDVDPDNTDDNGFLAEVFYRFGVNDNIAVTPSVIIRTSPLNDDGLDTTVIGSIRTTFTF